MEKLPSHWGADWQWFALRVEPGRELVVEARLREADHFTFVPLKHVVRKKSRHSKQKVLNARAQFPGYVFIGQPPGFELPWLKILEDPDTHGVIGQDGAPIAIREPSMVPMIIDRLLLVSRLNGRLRAAKGRRRKGKGPNMAEIVSGPYQAGPDDPPRVVRVIEVSGEDPEIYGLFKAA